MSIQQPPPFPENLADPAALDLSDRRPLPSVTVHAFLESASTLSAMRKAAQDRHLARAQITIEKGGVLAAAGHFARNPSGDVVIVETLGDRDLLLAQIDALAEVCEIGTRVIVIGTINDARLFRMLRNRGVEDYLLSPASSLALIDALTGLYARHEDTAEGKTLAFIGARGGVGSSTLALHVAWSLAHRHAEETLLADFDLSFGTAALAFNHEPAQTIADALAAGDHLDSQLMGRIKTPIGERLTLLAAAETLDLPMIVDSGWDAVLLRARQEAAFVVADLPLTWSSWMARALTDADRIVLTVTADLAALRNARMITAFLARSRPNDPPPIIVLNRYASSASGSTAITAKTVTEALGQTPFVIIQEDTALFSRATNNGHTLFDEKKEAPAAQAMDRLALHLAGRDLAPKTKAKANTMTGRLARLIPFQTTRQAS